MDKNVLKERIDAIVGKTDYKVENLSSELRAYGFKDPFRYGAWCEKMFENNVEPYKRKTTFTSDFSIAEYYVPIEGVEAVLDTLRRALEGWIDSVEFMTELVLVLNMKCWEHHERGNMEYSRMYGDLYYAVQDLFYDYYEGNDEALDYYYRCTD